MTIFILTLAALLFSLLAFVRRNEKWTIMTIGLWLAVAIIFLAPLLRH